MYKQNKYKADIFKIDYQGILPIEQNLVEQMGITLCVT